MLEARFLVVEVGAQRLLERGDDLGLPCDGQQASPVPRGQGDDHDPVPVSRDEVAGEAAVEVVADARAVDQVDLCLSQEAQVARHGKGNVLQCDAHLRTVAREGAAAVRRQHGHGRVQAAGHVPRRQDVVHRELVPFGAGHHGEAGGGVDRVVHGRGSVVLALDLDVDQVRARRSERLVRQPVAPDGVRQHDSRVADQRTERVAGLRRPEVHGDRLLALVEACPVEARLFVGDGPPPDVRAASGPGRP